MRYCAFISYSHVDEKWARWLMRQLESYRIPGKLVGKQGKWGPVPKRLGKVFRDRDELASAGSLNDAVKEALFNSQALIIICSPNAARSPWVNAEIKQFRELGRGSHIFTLVVGGEPNSTDPQLASFPPALLCPSGQGQAIPEPLAADARKHQDGRHRAFLKIVAGLIGVGFDSLVQRDAQKRVKRLALFSISTFAGMSLAIVLAINAVIARNDAERRQDQVEDILGFMLGDLRQNLETVGRLDLMNAVHEKATDYFATLNPRDLSDRTLEQQARSLTGIGEVRLNEGLYKQAMDAFKEAYSRTVMLYEREPENGQRLFDLTQAQYWLGLVAWQQARYQDAHFWLAQYRDDTIKLASMDKGNFDWQKEAAYGYHNMAVLDESLGNYAEAEASMLKQRKLYSDWLALYPEDPELRFEAANIDSWLGSLALKQGQLKQAEQYFQANRTAMEKNIAQEPKNMRWQEIWLDAIQLLAQVQLNLGKLQAANTNNSEGLIRARDLNQLDPNNSVWQVALGVSYLFQAQTETPVNNQFLSQANTHLSEANERNSKDKRTGIFLVKTYILQGAQALKVNDIELAAQFNELATALINQFWREPVSHDMLEIKLKQLLLATDIAIFRGDNQTKAASIQQANELLFAGGEGEVPFLCLDESVLLLQRQDRENEAQQYLTRLAESGYNARSLIFD